MAKNRGRVATARMNWRSGCRRKAVRFWKGSRMGAKIGGVLAALMGLACLCLGLYYASQEILLTVTGHATTGAVTEKTTSFDQDNK